MRLRSAGALEWSTNIFGPPRPSGSWTRPPLPRETKSSKSTAFALTRCSGSSTTAFRIPFSFDSGSRHDQTLWSQPADALSGHVHIVGIRHGALAVHMAVAEDHRGALLMTEVRGLFRFMDVIELLEQRIIRRGRR